MNQKSDDFDIFGQYIASELRQITDLSVQRAVKRDIQQAVLNGGNMLVTSAGRLQRTLIQTSTQPLADDCQIISIEDFANLPYTDDQSKVIAEYEFEQL